MVRSVTNAKKKKKKKNEKKKMCMTHFRLRFTVINVVTPCGRLIAACDSIIPRYDTKWSEITCNVSGPHWVVTQPHWACVTQMGLGGPHAVASPTIAGGNSQGMCLVHIFSRADRIDTTDSLICKWNSGNLNINSL